ncbi:MAG: cytochrome c oxidase subunit II [Candidatus Eremiobacteraeota bacterium]|nr:cytochrome c oxidase subunit II [Candidatus Eremiobacteraeota bacterium]
MVENSSAVRLDRGFWTVTAVFAVLSVFAFIFWYSTNALSFVLPPVGAQPGEDIDALFRFMAAFGSALFIFVAGYLTYFMIVFRARKTDAPDAIGVQIHDNHKLELWWTLIPTAFVVLLSILSVRIWYSIQVAQPANGLVVESIGHQWYYTFRYPQVHGEITDEMHLPLNVPVIMNVTSQDVIHSFWVPAFRLKADMVPGLINTIRFTPKIAGRYEIVCTEFCGTQHGAMNKQIVVVENQASFDTWYHGWQTKNARVSDALPKASSGAISLAGGDLKAGQAVFAQKCSACHAIGPYSQRIVGPGLKGVLHDSGHPNLVDGDKATPENVAKILQQGYKGELGVMPNASANGLTDKDIANLVAYLNSLK